MAVYISVLSTMMTVVGIRQINAMPEPFDLLVRMPTTFLEKRQTGTTSIPDVPAGCQSVCDPVNSAIAAGCTAAICCQSSFETGFFNCFKCAATALNVTDFSVPQQDVDALIDTCAALGLALPKLTFPGQNPNRTVSTAASSKPSTASISSAPAVTSQLTISDPLQTSLLSTTSTSQLVQSTVTSIPSTTSPVSQPSPSTTSSASSLKMASHTKLAAKVAALAITASLYFGL